MIKESPKVSAASLAKNRTECIKEREKKARKRKKNNVERQLDKRGYISLRWAGCSFRVAGIKVHLFMIQLPANAPDDALVLLTRM